MAERITSTANTPSAPSWAVVGGGMLGLATAWKLVNAGQQVNLFEAAPTLGGLTSPWQLGDVRWDKFYHVTLLSDSRLRELLRDIGLEHELRWVTTRTGFYCDGRLVSLNSSWDFLRFPPLSLLQKFRLGATIFYASRIRRAGRLEQIPVADWLRKLSGQATFQKIWLPLLKAKLGQAYQRTSAAFIWAYIDRMYKARRSGMKREMFGYVPGGYQRVLNTLSEQLVARGVQLHTSSPVTEVRRDDARQLLQVSYLRDGAPHQQEFQQVIMTTPSPIVAQTCPQLSEDERQRLQTIEYLGVCCTSLLLDGPLGGYYVTNITDDWVPLTGIIEMGSIVPPAELGGYYLVYLPQSLLASDAGFEESDEQIHERCLSTLEKMYPDFRRSRVAAIQTARARHVMPIPTLDYSKRLPPVVSSVPGLSILNSAQITEGTLNVNETLEVVERWLFREIVKGTAAGDV